MKAKVITVHTVEDMMDVIRNLKDHEILNIQIEYEKDGDVHGNETEQRADDI